MTCDSLVLNMCHASTRFVGLRQGTPRIICMSVYQLVRLQCCQEYIFDMSLNRVACSRCLRARTCMYVPVH